MFLLVSAALAQDPAPEVVVLDPVVFNVEAPNPDVTILVNRAPPAEQTLEVSVEIEVPENVGAGALR